MTRRSSRLGSLGAVLVLLVVTGGCAELSAPTSPSPAAASGKAGPSGTPSSRAGSVEASTGAASGETGRRVTRPGNRRASARTAEHAETARVNRHAASSRRSRRTTAAAQLATLTVRGRAPMTGYDRDRFGQAWLDADRNGCDTRNDVLRRDLHPYRLDSATNGCVVLSGVIDDPYTGRSIRFVRGGASEVDIDHVVALGNAWVSGGWRFDVHERAALANDPLNLLAVDAGANRSKGDSDAASWLPPYKPQRCAYVARQVAVKAKYRLSVTAAEKAQVSRQLAACPGLRRTPDPTHAPTRVDQHLTDAGSPSRSPRPAEAAPASPGRTVYYDNCDAARAAGAAPVHRGDPGYGSHLDRDGDGSGCE